MMDDEVPAEWSSLTHQVLRCAGWYPGRSVPLDKYELPLREFGGFEMHNEARRFLGEFAGLATDTWTPGPVMPQSTFRFEPCDVDANPEVCHGVQETFRRMDESAGARLYPIGHVDGGASCLGMAPDGSVYVGSADAELLAHSAYEALEKLVLERRTEAPLPYVLVGDHLELPPDFGATHGSDGIPRWSPETEHVLRLAGWYPGRTVSVESWEREMQEADDGYVMHDAVRRFLAEFGGLEVSQRGPGVDAARSPFRIDPSLAKWDFEIIDALSEDAEVYLYPVGDLSQGNSYLVMAESGAFYLGMDDVEPLADTADAALDKLVRGIR